MTCREPIRFFFLLPDDSDASWAYFFTLLRATLRFAAIVIDDRYTRDFVRHDGKE